MDDLKQSDVFIEVLLLLNHNCINNDKYEHDDECAICMDSMKNNYVITLSCKHTYHRNCILTNICKFKKYICPEVKCKKKI